MPKAKIIYTSKTSHDLLNRYPENTYSIVKIPYIYIDAKLDIIKVLNSQDIQKIKTKRPNFNINYITAIFKKLNWSVKNELNRKSIKFNPYNYKYEIDYQLYVKYIINDCLILLIFENMKKDLEIEQYIDDDIVSKLDKEIYFVTMYLNPVIYSLSVLIIHAKRRRGETGISSLDS